MAFSKAFGVIPSLKTAAEPVAAGLPGPTRRSRGAVVRAPGHRARRVTTQALSAFDSALQQLETGNPAAILKTAQQNLQAVSPGRMTVLARQDARGIPPPPADPRPQAPLHGPPPGGRRRVAHVRAR